MATLYSLETAPVGANPPSRVNDVAQRGKLKLLRNTITLASQATTDIIFLGNRPAGSRFHIGWLTSTVTFGVTTTIAIGIIGTPAKYKAAGTFQVVETPTPFGLTTAMDDVSLAADEGIYLTIGAAAFPAAGTLMVDIQYIES